MTTIKHVKTLGGIGQLVASGQDIAKVRYTVDMDSRQGAVDVLDGMGDLELGAAYTLVLDDQSRLQIAVRLMSVPTTHYEITVLELDNLS